MSIRISKKKNIVFSDFFDTVMFRYIHPFQVAERWCLLIARAYNVDKNIISTLRKKHNGNWNIMYRAIYEDLADIHETVTVEDFVERSLEVETAVEIGCQYPNSKFINFLRSCRASGKKIYVVSDFHLPKSSFEQFLRAKNIERDLFENLFISSDCAATKAQGTLYKYVLAKEGLKSNDVVMIGDNAFADGTMAESSGIASKIVPNYANRIRGQISRRLGEKWERRSLRYNMNACYRYNSPFAEYCILFYTFTYGLFSELERKKQNTVSFLAREGHFLKRAFDMYIRTIAPVDTKMQTSYIRCSRRSAQSLEPDKLEQLKNTPISLADWLYAHGFAREAVLNLQHEWNISDKNMFSSDEILCNTSLFRNLSSSCRFAEEVDDQIRNNISAGKKYFSQYLDGQTLNLVDIGWRGYMQDAIGDILGMKAMGYYVGLNNCDRDLKFRKGILFNYSPDQNVITGYADILRANTQIYEQLTAAPHGSALGYRLSGDGSVEVLEDWAENERYLYENFVIEKQDEMLLVMKGIMAWADEIPFSKKVRMCAKINLRSSLIASTERICFLEKLDKGFIWNFNKQTKGTSYNAKEVSIKPDILYAPERYTRFFAKLQRVFWQKYPKIKFLYWPVGWGLYLYIWGIVRIKDAMVKSVNVF